MAAKNSYVKHYRHELDGLREAVEENDGEIEKQIKHDLAQEFFADVAGYEHSRGDLAQVAELLAEAW